VPSSTRRRGTALERRFRVPPLHAAGRGPRPTTYARAPGDAPRPQGTRNRNISARKQFRSGRISAPTAVSAADPRQRRDTAGHARRAPRPSGDERAAAGRANSLCHERGSLSTLARPPGHSGCMATVHVASRTRPRPAAASHVSAARERKRVAVARRAGQVPEDAALYPCHCGHDFTAAVTTSVICPSCGDGQPW
jgi:hypothetical protein